MADRAKRSGKATLARIVGIFLILALAVGGYGMWRRLQRVESTDDAQVDGSIHAISARVPGHVMEVLVDDQQYVNAGDVLVRLDRADYEIAVAKAKADLGDALATLQTHRTDVPITTATTSSTLAGAQSSREDALAGVAVAEQQLGAARARLAWAQANVRTAEANAAKAAADVARYKVLVEKDEISKQLYDQTVSTAAAERATVDSQKATVNEAEQNIAVASRAVDQAKTKVALAEAGIQGALIGPQQVQATQSRANSSAAKVEQQRALLAQAELNLKYTLIVAPVSGIVGKKTVAAGQNVSPGQELMAIVPQEGLWVTANFKETQLGRMRPGQAVKIRVDAYGREFNGKIERIAGASGARFSLLPPENATGNYVKIVQRIPVRIALDAGQDRDHVLRPGMSVVPTVQVE
jgi:membrane fusion protein (multidrug efflux system)